MNHDDDDDDDDNKRKRRKHDEFECPECNAHNPVPDGYDDGSEVQCFYCGAEFKAVLQSGRFKFKAL